MKTLLSLILCASTVVFAQPLAVTPNVIGGYTVLTDEDCLTNEKYLQAYATDDKGGVTKACWYTKDDFIYFVPKNGILRRLPIDQFDLVAPIKKVKLGSKTNV
jgi:hypothetical protein